MTFQRAHCLFYFKKYKMYPRIGFFEKMTYPRIRIGPIPIRAMFGKAGLGGRLGAPNR